VNYFELIEKKKVVLARMGDKGYLIENREVLKQDREVNNKDYVQQEVWQNYTAKQKIDKMFRFSDRSQNPPNYLFKQLTDQEKKEFYVKRRAWRTKRYTELYQMIKESPVKAALAYDNFYHYAIRDQYGFKMDEPKAGLTGEFADSKDDLTIRDELENNWVEQGKRKRLFNIVLVNRRKIYTKGNCSRFILSRSRNNRQGNFRNRKYLEIKRNRNGGFIPAGNRPNWKRNNNRQNNNKRNGSQGNNRPERDQNQQSMEQDYDSDKMDQMYWGSGNNNINNNNIGNNGNKVNSQNQNF
jgi:hypothetical protein